MRLCAPPPPPPQVMQSHKDSQDIGNDNQHAALETTNCQCASNSSQKQAPSAASVRSPDQKADGGKTDSRVWHMRARLLSKMHEQQIEGRQSRRQPTAVLLADRPLRNEDHRYQANRNDIERQNRDEIYELALEKQKVLKLSYRAKCVRNSTDCKGQAVNASEVSRECEWVLKSQISKGRRAFASDQVLSQSQRLSDKLSVLCIENRRLCADASKSKGDNRQP